MLNDGNVLNRCSPQLMKQVGKHFMLSVISRSSGQEVDTTSHRHTPIELQNKYKYHVTYSFIPSAEDAISLYVTDSRNSS